MGKVYLAGAGPWNAGLVTVKCAEVLGRADAVVYDNLVNPSILNYTSGDAELIYAGKRSGSHHLRQEEINALLVRLADEGKTVVRLKGGDPYVFGRGGEEAEELIRHGIEFEVISGVSSSYSVPASAGIAVTHRNFASSFHVITGHESGCGGRLDYKALAELSGTLIFLMGKNLLPDIAAELIRNGKPPSTPCAVISEGTSAKEQSVTETLRDIAEKAEELPMPALIAVGGAAGHIIGRKKRGKLSGKRIINAGKLGSLRGLEEAAEREGAEVLRIPLIKTKKINYEKFKALDISGYTHIAFSSAAGVEVFFQYIKDIDIRALAGAKIAAVGKATAKAVESYGIIPDTAPELQRAEGLLSVLENSVNAESKVLLPCAVQSRGILYDGLKQLCPAVDRIEIYSTEPDFSRRELFNLYEGSADYIVITSGSCADAFKAMKSGGNSGRLIAIGAVTAAYMEEIGLKAVTAAQPDVASVIEACCHMELY